MLSQGFLNIICVDVRCFTKAYSNAAVAMLSKLLLTPFIKIFTVGPW